MVLIVCTMVSVLHVLWLLMVLGISYFKWFGFTRGDKVAVMFCSTHKTIALGIPMINILFEGDENIGLKALPLLVYHQVQLIVAALLITKLKEWIQSGPTTEERATLLPHEK